MKTKQTDIRALIIWITLGLTTAFIYNFSLKEYVFPSDIYIALLLTLCLGALLAVVGRELIAKAKGLKKKDFILPAVALILIPLFILIRNGDIANGNFGKPFFSLFAIALFIIFVYVKDTVKPALALISAFTLEHVFFTWFFYFCPTLYKNHILGLFPDFQAELLYQFEHRQMAGLTMHYSLNSIYLSIGVIVFCAGIIRAAGKKQFITNIVLAVLTMSALLITGKRGPLVFVVAAVFAMYFFSNIKDIKKTLIRAGIILVAAAVIILVLSVFIPSLTEPFERFFNQKDITNGRMGMYGLAVDNFLENPVFGVGWGEYKYIFEDSALTSTQSRMDAHNVYLQLLCEVGVIGFILFIAVFAITLYKTVKAVTRAMADKTLGIGLVFSLGMQVYFLLYCITGNALYDIYAFYPYAIGCAIMFGETKNEK